MKEESLGVSTMSSSTSKVVASVLLPRTDGAMVMVGVTDVNKQHRLSDGEKNNFASCFLVNLLLEKAEDK